MCESRCSTLEQVDESQGRAQTCLSQAGAGETVRTGMTVVQKFLIRCSVVSLLAGFVCQSLVATPGRVRKAPAYRPYVGITYTVLSPDAVWYHVNRIVQYDGCAWFHDTESENNDHVCGAYTIQIEQLALDEATPIK